MQTFWDMTISAYWAWRCWDAREGQFHSAQGAGGLGLRLPRGHRRRRSATGRAGTGCWPSPATVAPCTRSPNWPPPASTTLPVTWLIVDDGGYGILREYMVGAFGKATATELARPDFAALATSFGIPAHTATPDTVGDVVAATFGTDGPGPAVVVLPALLRMFAPTHLPESAPTHPHLTTRPRNETVGKPLDIAIVVVYLAAMLAFGFWGKTRTKDSADFLVAGRRLGPVFYTGTMAAVVLGGASTVGGVGLGYKWGISGMWLVVAIAVGLLALSLVFAGRIQRLRVYTVARC